MQFESGSNPYVAVVANKQRNLNKKLQKIYKIEDQFASGKEIDNDQKILCGSKPRIEASLVDLAGIRAALEEVAKKEAEKEAEKEEESREEAITATVPQPEVIPAQVAQPAPQMVLGLMQRQGILYLMQIGAYQAEVIPDIQGYLERTGHCMFVDEAPPSFALRPDWSVFDFLGVSDDRPAPTTEEEAQAAELNEQQIMANVACGLVPIGLVPHLLARYGANPALPVTQK